ncbi:hypothetical protein JW906_01910, partial [bacterium]|nr:hypothetical protein [bacterium]
TATSYQVNGLSEGTTYYWRVNATGPGGTSGWSDDWHFTTVVSPPPVPTLLSPSNGAMGVATGPTLSWNSMSGASSYGLQVSTDSIFTSLVSDQSEIIATSQQVSGLSEGTTYYWRVNATGSGGTSDWSERWDFKTSFAYETGTMIGNDGKIYQTVKIGTQWWMAENLRETKYRNGSAIPNVTTYSTWASLYSGARCAYENKQSNADEYGYLYNWYAVNDSRDIAPQGWHVPTDSEWQTLVDYLGGESGAGGKMKETGTSHWISPNSGATNESGFTALPGGCYSYNNKGTFNYLGYHAYFWSSTQYDIWLAWYRNLNYYHSNVDRNYSSGKSSGISVRLVKD